MPLKARATFSQGRAIHDSAFASVLRTRAKKCPIIPTTHPKIYVLDKLGRILETRTASEMMQFDVSGYADGIYMVQFFTADNRVMNKRFVKMK